MAEPTTSTASTAPAVAPIPADSTAQRPFSAPMNHQQPLHAPPRGYYRPEQPPAGAHPPGMQYFYAPAGLAPRQNLAVGMPSDPHAALNPALARPGGFPRPPQNFLTPNATNVPRPVVANSQRPQGSASSLMGASLQSYGVIYPGQRPKSSAMPALTHALPPMANKAIAWPANRPAQNFVARGTPQSSVRAHMPQMSRQAYLQQASAQLQNFQGTQLYGYNGVSQEGNPALSKPAAVPYSYRPPHSAPNAGPRPPGPVQGGVPRPGSYPRGNPPGPSGPAFPTLPPNIHMRARHIRPVQIAAQPQVPAGSNGGATARPPGAPQGEWAGMYLALSLADTITIADRKIRVDKDEGSTPMYVLLRRWMQNEPMIYTPARDRLLVPRGAWPKAMEEDSIPPPKMQADLSRLRLGHEELIRSNKQHWLRVRRHHVLRRHRRLNQFRQRLATLIPDPALKKPSPAAVDVPEACSREPSAWEPFQSNESNAQDGGNGAAESGKYAEAARASPMDASVQLEAAEEMLE